MEQTDFSEKTIKCITSIWNSHKLSPFDCIQMRMHHLKSSRAPGPCWIHCITSNRQQHTLSSIEWVGMHHLEQPNTKWRYREDAGDFERKMNWLRKRWCYPHVIGITKKQWPHRKTSCIVQKKFKCMSSNQNWQTVALVYWPPISNSCEDIANI